MVGFGGSALEARCETVLLGRLGGELARVYQDTLQAPLPSGLKALLERLDVALGHQDNEPGQRD